MCQKQGQDKDSEEEQTKKAFWGLPGAAFPQSDRISGERTSIKDPNQNLAMGGPQAARNLEVWLLTALIC